MNIDQLQALCTSLPAVTQDVKWDHDLCFSVGGKMFCVASIDPPLNISFKVEDEAFEELSQSEGIIPAPYMARAKWIQVQKPGIWNKKQWEERIRRSYDLTKAKLTKKARTELGLES
jgi:predicted DNA-binding protein (MmcQ/YjbR family)